MKEIFKDIKGYKGLYQITNTGKVYSLISNKFLQTVKRRSAQTSYEYLTLVKDKVKVTKTVHRLVAIHFIDNINNKPCVNHIDNNGLNNKVSNLEWCTYSENLKHAQKQGRLYEAQSKGGKATTEINKSRALADAKEMVGTTIQNWKIVTYIGSKPVGRNKIMRHAFVCTCTNCNHTTEMTREHLKALGKSQCRKCNAKQKTNERYTELVNTLVGIKVKTWKILGITTPITTIRTCKVHVECVECGELRYIAYSSYCSDKIPNCKCKGSSRFGLT